MNFSFSQTKGATEGGKFLGAGIHKAKFNGIEYDTVNTKNGEANVMVLKLDVDGYGEFKHNFFEPQSDERQEMQWGPSASQVDHFLISVRQILEALNPQLVKDLDEGKITLEGSFAKIVKTIKKLTDEFVGDEVEIKRREIQEAISGNGQLQRPSGRHPKYDLFRELYPRYGLGFSVRKCLRKDLIRIHAKDLVREIRKVIKI